MAKMCIFKTTNETNTYICVSNNKHNYVQILKANDAKLIMWDLRNKCNEFFFFFSIFFISLLLYKNLKLGFEIHYNSIHNEFQIPILNSYITNTWVSQEAPIFKWIISIILNSNVFTRQGWVISSLDSRSEGSWFDSSRTLILLWYLGCWRSLFVKVRLCLTRCMA